jgi:uncharacterized protein YxjI
MLYKIKEKFWSIGDKFTIFDEQDKEKYYVIGKAFSWGAKLSFQDIHNNELAFIEQKLLSWKKRYNILIDGQVFAEITKEITWFKKKFRMDIPGPNDYTIDGSFWNHEFVFTRDSGQQVATVSKKMWSWSDSYGVEVVEGENDVAILCACIVIDQVIDDERGAAAGGSAG